MEFKTPIEMPRGTHYGNDYYTTFSVKVQRIVRFFSKLEYYNFLAVELDPEVETFCEQPCQIEIVEDGKIKKAVFDMWVKYKDGREELQEVKYSKELEGDTTAAVRSQEQIRRQKHWCKENGIDAVVRTENDLISGEFVIQNRSVLAGMLRRYTPTDEGFYSSRILRYLSDADYYHKKVYVGDLLKQELLPVGGEWPYIACMYATGLINMDICNKPLDARTEVWQYAQADRQTTPQKTEGDLVGCKPLCHD